MQDVPAPPKEPMARVRILDAAEVAFAERGFEGAGMRGIAADAGVAQGLVHHYFGSKERLYGEVVARRTEAINGAREQALDALLAGPGTPSLETLLEAMFRPALENKTGGGRAYARMVASMASGGPRDRALVTKYYDPIALRFIDVIVASHPELPHRDAAWGYGFCMHLLVGAMARTGRVERLAGEDEASTDRLLERLVRFAAAGLRAVTPPDAPGRPGPADTRGDAT